MYRAHSKDINRNKSFHPLTFGNLRRVEKLKEGEEEQRRTQAERQKELQRDQEERRYDELVLASTAEGFRGEQAHFRHVKNIFAAEYDADAKRAAEQSSKEAPPAPATTAPPPLDRSTPAAVSFLGKFKAAPDSERVKQEPQSVHAAPPVHDRRGSESHSTRDGHEKDKNNSSATKRERSSDEPSSDAPTTGFVSSGEASRLRKELDLLKKRRVDPLRHVEAFQNRAVVAAARAQKEQQGRESQQKTAAPQEAPKQSMSEHIRALLELKKGK